MALRREFYEGDFVRPGPVLQVNIEPHFFDSESLAGSAGKMPFPCKCLVDTGASFTFIDDTVVNALELEPISMRQIHCLGGELKTCPVYDILIYLPGFDEPLEAEALGLTLFQHVHCLLGVDQLQKLRLRADGPQRIFMLERGL